MDNQQTAANSSNGSAKQEPVGFTKRKKFLFFKIKSKPIYSPSAGGSAKPATGAPSAPTQQPNTPAASNTTQAARPQTYAKTPAQPVQQAARSKVTAAVQQKAAAKTAAPPSGALSKRSKYITKFVVNKKGLQEALRDIGIKEEPYYFVRRMIRYAIVTSAIISAVLGYVLYMLNIGPGPALLLALVMALAFYNILFNKFASYPIARIKKIGRDIEKDILFATRDLVISMRSGMPLFNAMTAVSTGYGAASKEFSKVVSLIQLGMPIEQAMEDVSTRSQSKTFKRLMLQASVSIKVGADIIGSLQSVVDEIMEERVIELRRYGQRLNALAMFYMIFGVIFPSMGIAIATIMSTFISLFTINASTLAFVIVGIVGLQLIFLNLISSSRPPFSME